MKKSIFFLMMSILLCQFAITNVMAIGRIITPAEIVKGANEYDNGVSTIKDDSINKQFIVTYLSNVNLFFPYADDHLEITHDNLVTEDDISKAFYDSIGVYMITAGAYKSLGCTDEQIDNIMSWYDGSDAINNYDKYGIDFEMDKYSFKDDFGETSGTYVKYFKFSFDSEKLQNVINDFSYRENPDSSDSDDDKDVVPSISFGTITAQSIAIAAKVSEELGFVTVPDCNIYRSDSLDGNYELIGTITCDGSNYLYDKNVSEGKNYFYKASVVGYNNFSKSYNALAVTSKSTPTVNPDTGSPVAYVIGSLILVLIFASAIVFGRNKLEIK